MSLFLFVFTMAGNDGASPEDFNECVSQAHLQAFMDGTRAEMREEIREAVVMSVTENINTLRLQEVFQGITGQFTMLTDRIAALETRPPPQPVDPDLVYDVHGKVDEEAT